MVSLTPRSSRRRATIAAMLISSLSFSLGIRFMRFPLQHVHTRGKLRPPRSTSNTPITDCRSVAPSAANIRATSMPSHALAPIAAVRTASAFAFSIRATWTTVAIALAPLATGGWLSVSAILPSNLIASCSSGRPPRELRYDHAVSRGPPPHPSLSGQRRGSRLPETRHRGRLQLATTRHAQRSNRIVSCGNHSAAPPSATTICVRHPKRGLPGNAR